MSCEIASVSVEPEVLAWPSIGGEAPVSAPMFKQVTATSANEPDAAELKSRLAELERYQQAAITKAREAGFQEGFRQAREQAAGEVKVAGERLGRLLEELASLKHKIRSEAEVELVNLSLAIARRILHRQISIDAEAIHGLVHAA